MCAASNVYIFNLTIRGHGSGAVASAAAKPSRQSDGVFVRVCLVLDAVHGQCVCVCIHSFLFRTPRKPIAAGGWLVHVCLSEKAFIGRSASFLLSFNFFLAFSISRLCSFYL